MIYTKPPKGMRDFLPKELDIRTFVENTILNTYKRYGFAQVETSCLEDLVLLGGSDAGENEKMIFKILKRGESLNKASVSENSLADLGFRFDLTVPLCRFYANNRSILPTSFKVIQIGNVWRAERPQKGRFRQFVQCDIDIIGVEGIMAEIELILATAEALISLGFRGFNVRINDRRILESLAEFCGLEKSSFPKFFIILDKFDKIGISGVQRELIANGFLEDVANRLANLIGELNKPMLSLQEISSILSKVDSRIIDDLQTVMNTVSIFADARYNIVYDLTLVRGMGYYTGEIFEISVPGVGYSVAGGGRYDKMIGRILQSNEEIPACGFSIGFERIVSILEAQNINLPTNEKKLVILYPRELTETVQLFLMAKSLRDQGMTVLLEAQKKNLHSQLERLSEEGFTQFAFYDNELPLEMKSFTRLEMPNLTAKELNDELNSSIT